MLYRQVFSHINKVFKSSGWYLIEGHFTLERERFPSNEEWKEVSLAKSLRARKDVWGGKLHFHREIRIYSSRGSNMNGAVQELCSNLKLSAGLRQPLKGLCKTCTYKWSSQIWISSSLIYQHIYAQFPQRYSRCLPHLLKCFASSI